MSTGTCLGNVFGRLSGNELQPNIPVDEGKSPAPLAPRAVLDKREIWFSPTCGHLRQLQIPRPPLKSALGLKAAAPQRLATPDVVHSVESELSAEPASFYDLRNMHELRERIAFDDDTPQFGTKTVLPFDEALARLTNDTLVQRQQMENVLKCVLEENQTRPAELTKLFKQENPFELFMIDRERALQRPALEMVHQTYPNFEDTLVRLATKARDSSTTKSERRKTIRSRIAKIEAIQARKIEPDYEPKPDEERQALFGLDGAFIGEKKTARDLEKEVDEWIREAKNPSKASRKRGFEELESPDREAHLSKKPRLSRLMYPKIVRTFRRCAFGMS